MNFIRFPDGETHGPSDLFMAPVSLLIALQVYGEVVAEVMREPVWTDETRVRLQRAFERLCEVGHSVRQIAILRPTLPTILLV